MHKPFASMQIAKQPEAVAVVIFYLVIIATDKLPAPPSSFDSLGAPGVLDRVGATCVAEGFWQAVWAVVMWCVNASGFLQQKERT